MLKHKHARQRCQLPYICFCISIPSLFTSLASTAKRS